MNPITLSVVRGRLERIADEMDATLFRSAFNPIIAEAHDASHGMYDAETGATLIQGKTGLPIFVGAMAFAVKAVIDRVRAGVTLNEGDVFFFNDPYEGATHLNDFKLVKPIFREGELFCFLASVGHWHDVGGNVPGNYNPAATESFQEGFRVPPVKLYSSGALNRDIVEIILANTRLPQSCFGDLNGQINALDLGQARLNDLLDEYGTSTIREVLTELQTRSAQLMRSYIQKLPNGVWSAHDVLDHDGHQDQSLHLNLTLTIEGDEMTLDFDGSSPACLGPLNISYATTIAGCYVALKHLFVDVPANAGCLEPIQFKVPEGSILHALPPRPVGGYTETVLRVIDVIFAALAQVDPTLSNGAAYGTINALSLAGHRQSGQRWVMFSFFGGGLGGNPEGDGLNHGNAPISTATIPPLEILEAAYPIKFTRWGLRQDSGGPGRHRGGLGAEYELKLLEESADLFFFGERGLSAPPGVCGGQEAARNEFYYDKDGARIQPPLVSKVRGDHIRRGDRVCIYSPGGGGYGPPLERDPQAVARDVRLGYVSREHALEAYGVCLTEGGEVDADATRRQRQISSTPSSAAQSGGES